MSHDRSERTPSTSQMLAILGKQGPQDDTAPLFSSDKQIIDYVTITGIKTRTRVESEFAVFVLEQLLLTEGKRLHAYEKK
ncbi:MAG: hypothetical protein WAM14_02595 [Candidatus Nitrosopolaris sp.]